MWPEASGEQLSNLTKAKERKDIDAIYYLSQRYYFSNRNLTLEERYKNLCEAVKGGHSEAKEQLENFDLKGKFGYHDEIAPFYSATDIDRLRKLVDKDKTGILSYNLAMLLISTGKGSSEEIKELFKKAAANGLEKAKVDHGKFLVKEKNYVDAIHIFNSVNDNSKKEKGEALYQKAKLWEIDLPLFRVKNDQHMLYFLEKAAKEYEHSDAKYELDRHYLKGDIVQQDVQKAQSWFLSCNQNYQYHKKATYELYKAQYYKIEELNSPTNSLDICALKIESNPASNASYFKELISREKEVDETTDGITYYWLGHAYRNGLGEAQKDLVKAAHYLTKALEEGYYSKGSIELDNNNHELFLASEQNEGLKDQLGKIFYLQARAYEKQNIIPEALRLLYKAKEHNALLRITT